MSIFLKNFITWKCVLIILKRERIYNSDLSVILSSRASPRYFTDEIPLLTTKLRK